MSPSIMSFLRLLGFTPAEVPSKKNAAAKTMLMVIDIEEKMHSRRQPRQTGIRSFTATWSPQPQAQLQPAVTAHVSLACLTRVNKIGHYVPQNHFALCLCVLICIKGPVGLGFLLGWHAHLHKQARAGREGEPPQ